MTNKEQTAWNSIKDWLEKFNEDKHPYEQIPAADLLTLIHEAEVENVVDK